MDLRKLKFNATDVHELTSEPKNQAGLTPIQKKEYKRLLGLNKTTEKQEQKIAYFEEKLQAEVVDSIPTKVKQKAIEIYSFYAWGKSKHILSQEPTEIRPSHTLAGTLCEGESIRLLSEIEGNQYTKNTQKYANRYIIGIPDIIHNETVKDIKTSTDLPSFLKKKLRQPTAKELTQMWCYLAITGLKQGEICYTLTTPPQELIESQIKAIRRQSLEMGTTRQAEQKRIDYLLQNTDFDKIPLHSRIIKHKVEPNPEFIKQSERKLKDIKKFLTQFHELVINK